MKTLFVDEDWEIEVLLNVLRARHPEDEFDLAETLDQARKAIWAVKYDILVLDVMMPSDDVVVPKSSDKAGLLSGLLLKDLIRSDANCPNKDTKIIILTGLLPSEDSKVTEAQQIQGDLFLQKPMHPDAMYEILARESVNSK